MIFQRSHLQIVKQKYFEHFWFAFKWGFYLIFIGIASIIHGFFPAVFPFLAPKGVLKIAKMIKERNIPGEFTDSEQ